MRALGQYFARALVRRVAYAVAAVLVASVLHLCSAGAQAAAQSCGPNPVTCDQGEAFVAATNLADSEGPRICKMVGGSTVTYTGANVRLADAGTYLAQVACSNGSNTANAGSTYFSQSCQSRNSRYPPGDAPPWYSEPAKCIGGCQITGETFSQSNGGMKVYGQRNRYYTGQTCSRPKGQEGIGPEGDNKEAPQKPKQDECVALGSGQTSCSKPNGDHCATSSTGKTFCWKPGQEGSQADGSDGQSKSPQGKPVAPPSQPAPPEQEWQRKEGHQNEVCVGTSCTTYNVTNYRSVPNGTAKNGTGDNAPDGGKNTSGNGKPGTGSGGGSSSDDGEGDSATDSGNCEQAPACTGDTLKCLHLTFTWKIQCNTKGSTISGGQGCSNSDVPVCVGSSCKAEAYSQLLQQWRSRCAVEGIKGSVEGHAGQGDGDNGEGSIFIDDSGKELSLDEGKVAYGGGQLGFSLSVEGIKFEMPQQVLDFIAVLRVLIIAGATLTAIAIIRGN
ncbi:A coat protein [Stenotrophomonas sp. VV52]|uniref:A coat protein n=1 Tax=Stenotrophomonas sp. VV52 TaxID=2066958 RepID=UPI001C0F063B|nr:A coat protein [Stenotrophomonas sp. VV52]